ncbi:fused MFS/spermidine synthase [Candidatus Gottesmanbacteria bacterium]|nr:fused MFS/spermidine synthase [Candidatus Gottesmanbacteria bacterium]
MSSPIPIFWTAYGNVGIKRFLFLIGIEIGLVLIGWSHVYSRPFGDIIAGSLLTFIILYCIAVLKYGLFVRRYSFREHGETYEIKDYYKPFEPSKNYRVLSRINSNQRDSKIFFTKQPRWAYLDAVRVLLNTIKPHKRASVLLLGGGGASLAKTMAESYPSCHVDVVEVSKIMISVAKRFFLSSREAKQISLLHQDAQLYIAQTKRRYDVIIVDLFVNSEVSNDSTNTQFVHNLSRVCSPRTVIIINLSGIQELTLQRIINLYEYAFPRFQLYLHWKTALLLITGNQVKNIPLHFTRISVLKKARHTRVLSQLYAS